MGDIWLFFNPVLIGNSPETIHSLCWFNRIMTFTIADENPTGLVRLSPQIQMSLPKEKMRIWFCQVGAFNVEISSTTYFLDIGYKL